MDPDEYETPEDKKVRHDSHLRWALRLGIILVVVIVIVVIGTIVSPPERVFLIGLSCALAIGFFLSMRSGWRRREFW